MIENKFSKIRKNREYYSRIKYIQNILNTSFQREKKSQHPSNLCTAPNNYFSSYINLNNMIECALKRNHKKDYHDSNKNHGKKKNSSVFIELDDSNETEYPNIPTLNTQKNHEIHKPHSKKKFNTQLLKRDHRKSYYSEKLLKMVRESKDLKTLLENSKKYHEHHYHHHEYMTFLHKSLAKNNLLCDISAIPENYLHLRYPVHDFMETDNTDSYVSFTCPICEISLPTYYIWKAHLSLHLYIPEISCPYCSKHHHPSSNHPITESRNSIFKSSSSSSVCRSLAPYHIPITFNTLYHYLKHIIEQHPHINHTILTHLSLPYISYLYKNELFKSKDDYVLDNSATTFAFQKESYFTTL